MLFKMWLVSIKLMNWWFKPDTIQYFIYTQNLLVRPVIKGWQCQRYSSHLMKGLALPEILLPPYERAGIARDTPPTL
jgi:hypothetical protein